MTAPATPSPLRDARFFGALAAAIPACLGMAWLQGKSIDPASWYFDPRDFLLYVVVRPLVEEIAFRGLIQEALLERLSVRIGALSAANLITSVLFAAAHLGTRETWLAVATFVPSLVFGYFRERHGSLASPIALHAFYNGTALQFLR